MMGKMKLSQHRGAAQGDAIPLLCSPTVTTATQNGNQQPSIEGSVETAGNSHCGTEMTQNNAQAQHQNSGGEGRSGLMCVDRAVRS